MRAKKCIAASILFGILMIGLTICTSAKVKIKENGEYRYRVLNQRSDEMRGRGTELGIYDGIEQGICLERKCPDYKPPRTRLRSAPNATVHN